MSAEKRPTWKNVREDFYLKVKDYFIDCGMKDEEIILEDIKEIYNCGSDMFKDAYNVAKDFEDKGWSVNSSFVEMLDNIYNIYSELLDAAITQWVLDFGIKPKIPEGTKVNYKNEEFVVKYDDYFLKRGQYLLPKNQDKDSSWIVPFEKIETLYKVEE